MSLKSIGNIINGLNSGLSVNALVDSFKQLDDTQKALAISSANLSNYQKSEAMIQAGVSTSTINATVAKKGSTVATNENTVATSTNSGAQTANVATTTALSSAYKGLSASLGMTTMALTACIGAIVALGAGYLIYKQVEKHNEELRQSAQESLDTYKDLSKSIDEYKDRMKPEN